ncbi:hypothetical protein JZ751_014899 [Albula glossodonta]|uniref:NAD(+) kinase n=1 Tax=Albula glossodonta TaxID=121402 RepID=A0A8T2N024_9TELE|nr:hypothetical protein JZ751_014899 [Albula glossodonta]
MMWVWCSRKSCHFRLLFPEALAMEDSKGNSWAMTAPESSMEAVPYCCAACDGGELHSRGTAMRGRPKARSLSASPALCNSTDYRRTQSLHGPSPVTTFGPKACMLQNPKAVISALQWEGLYSFVGRTVLTSSFQVCFKMFKSLAQRQNELLGFRHEICLNKQRAVTLANRHIQDPASQRLTWNKPPKSVLVIKKIRDASLLQPFKELCIFLTEVKGMIVYVERKVLEDPAIAGDESFVAVKKKFCTFREDFDDISDQESVPPVMAFHLGSLGFLTPFNFDSYQSQVTQIIEGLIRTGNAAIVLRSRLKVKVVKECKEKKPTTIQSGVDEKGLILTNGETETSRRAMQYQVLNEVVVDRGPSSYLSNVDLFLDGHLITTVQGDGVIVSTPTGSTAYAVAAGASMIHPNVPAIMITPICPHSLSFRPIVVPAGVELKIMLSRDARNTAWVSFDGRKRQEICHGDR